MRFFLRELFGFEYEICRRCINDMHNIHLKPEHCVYDHYSYNCPRCGAHSHIVRKLTIEGRIRLILHRKKAKEIEENLL